jgi:Kef-type K+ transport system membrane component KefB
LVLFLFIVGLEIDASHIRRNTRVSVTIALFAMVIPFGIGVGISKLIYTHFIPSSVKYTHYMLFNGVSFSITAFPVLCRILTELKLLDTTVGVVVLSAGVCNDIVGWTLLALAVALVNASSSLTALWVIMATFGWSLFLVFPVRWGLFWFARRANSLNENPSLLFMTVTMMFVLVSSFFTDVIGVHAIFGGFLAGLAVPREGGLAIALVEKLEDMVGIIFLPLVSSITLRCALNLQLIAQTSISLFPVFPQTWDCSIPARFGVSRSCSS